MSRTILQTASVVLAAAASGLWAALLFSARSPPPPERGRRGVERAIALAKGGSFAVLEPLVRLIAGHVSAFELKRLREIQCVRLRRAGDYLGLTPDEYSALILLAAAAFGALVAVLASLLEKPVLLAAGIGVLCGGWLPISQVEGAYRRRARNITRGLPGAIYGVALCMSAGLDFPGALRLITRNTQLESDDVSKELALILESLQLGHTRKLALQGLAERTPTPPVRDFVRAVVQSEEQGNPLSQTLLVQARALNLKRAVAAEEAAARAAVLMLGPLMLLMGCILLILMGPFIVSGGGS